MIYLLKAILLNFILLYAVAGDVVYRINVDGGIGVGTSEYVASGINTASNVGAKLIILTIDTPGGADSATREIIKNILQSKVPVATFVYPSGARAASAGTYILYSSHIAAMSPGTNLGAATPVNLFSSGQQAPAQAQDKDNTESTMMSKVKNDSAAYIKSLAELRKRNVAFAKNSVLNAESISVDEALAKKVIDFKANDINDLLNKVNGMQVNVNGEQQTIELNTPEIKEHVVDFKARFLLFISDPSIVYWLFLAGIYCLFLEFTNPGIMVPGVIGGILLVLALYGLNMLPINYAGVALLVMGAIFIIMELFFGGILIFGIGGIIAIVAGTLLLYNTDSVAYEMTYSFLASVILVNLLILGIVFYLAINSAHRKIMNGVQFLSDSVGYALTDINEDSGKVKINGEIWDAKSTQPIANNQKVRVQQVTGLCLQVTKYQQLNNKE